MTYMDHLHIQDLALVEDCLESADRADSFDSASRQSFMVPSAKVCTAVPKEGNNQSI